MGSWKIIEISLPRIARIALGPSSRRFLPRNRMRPPTIFPGGSETSRRIESDVTLFPLPDSPTTARVSPSRTSKETPSTARTTPSSVKKCVRRSSRRRSGRFTAAPLPPTAGRLQPAGAAPSRRLSSRHAARVEGVAQPVAEEIERHHREEDRGPRRPQEPREGGEHAQAPRLVQHVAPRRGRLLHAHSEEREEHLSQD